MSLSRPNLVAPGLFLMAICAQATAAENLSNWTPVVAADLAGTPDMHLRDPQSLNLAAVGDFNGDGATDRAYIAKADQSRYGIVACLSRPEAGCKEVLVTSGPIAHLRTLGIDKNSFADLGVEFRNSPDGRKLFEVAERSKAPDFLEVFAFEASLTAYTWVGDRFEAIELQD